MFDLFQPTHLLFVLLVALVVLGPKRLAETSRSLGRTIRSFQEYKDEFKEGLLGMSGESELDEKHSGKERPPTKRPMDEEKANDKESRG